MTTGSLIWLIIFVVSVAVFFIVAAVVSVRGFGDLRDLLSAPDKRGRPMSDKL
jgi:hypothetical protein